MKFKIGDKVEASDEYRNRKDPALRDDGTVSVFAPFVVTKIKKGPVWDKHANGYNCAGWIHEDIIYDERGGRHGMGGHRASRLQKSE